MRSARVHSRIANGRTVSIDIAAAEQTPGVLAVLTHHNMLRMNPTPKPWSHLHPYGQGYLPVQDDKIHYAGQPIASVVAETLDPRCLRRDVDPGAVRERATCRLQCKDGDGGRRPAAFPVAGGFGGR